MNKIEISEFWQNRIADVIVLAGNSAFVVFVVVFLGIISLAGMAVGQILNSVL